MPDRTQDLTNHRKVAQASKNYTDKKINDLKWELGAYDLGVETINGTTMLLPTPENTLQATMVRVDGKSEVSENLYISTDVAQTTIGGITYKIENGVITLISGTAYDETYGSVYIYLSAPTDYINYQFNVCLFNDFIDSNIVYSQRRNTSWGVWIACNVLNANYTFNSNSNINAHRIQIANGTTVNNYKIKLMIVKGSTAPTIYKPYFDGIHNLELSGLKVEGANLFDKTAVTLDKVLNATTGVISNDNNSFVSDYVEVIEGATYNYNLGVSFGTAFYDNNKTFISGSSYSTTFTIPSGAKYIRMSAYKTRLDTLMISKGSTIPTTYQPYITPTTLPIDLTSIEDSGGNKLFADNSIKGDENVQDIITPTYQESAWDKLDLGSLSYERNYSSTSDMYYFVAQLDEKALGKYNLLCAMYGLNDNNGGYSQLENMNMVGRGSLQNQHNYIYIRNDNYSTAEAFKTAMSGVILNFERATHLTSNTDLLQLVKFEAHSNGFITFVNTNNQDTTSTFKYLKEVAK